MWIFRVGPRGYMYRLPPKLKAKRTLPSLSIFCWVDVAFHAKVSRSLPKMFLTRLSWEALLSYRSFTPLKMATRYGRARAFLVVPKWVTQMGGPSMEEKEVGCGSQQVFCLFGREKLDSWSRCEEQGLGYQGWTAGERNKGREGVWG